MARKARGLIALVLLFAPHALALPPVDAPDSGAPSGTRLSIGIKLKSGALEREYGGFVALSLPLDKFSAPRKLAQSTRPSETPSVEGGADEPSTAQESPTEKPPSKPPPAAKSPPQRSPITPRVFVALARSSVRQALISAGTARRRAELDGLASRARGSAALPELKLRAARSNDQALRLAPTTDDPYRYSLAGGTDLLLEATATWRLDRLLFADEEVPLARVAIERDKLEAALVQKTLLRLFAWWRALRQSRDVTLPPDEREQAELATWEAQAELDVLTDGWFSQRLNELGLSSVLEEQDMGAAEDPKADSPAKPAGKEGDAPAQARPAAKSAAGNATQSGPALAELGRAAKVR